MEIKKNKKRRTARRVMTKEAQILKYLRESRGLSTRNAARLSGLSSAKVSHAENGRRDLTPDFILKLLEVYDYSYADFIEMCEGKIEVPEHLRSECIEIIKRLSMEKLRSVKAILQSF